MSLDLAAIEITTNQSLSVLGANNKLLLEALQRQIQENETLRAENKQLKATLLSNDRRNPNDIQTAQTGSLEQIFRINAELQANDDDVRIHSDKARSRSVSRNDRRSRAEHATVCGRKDTELDRPGTSSDAFKTKVAERDLSKPSDTSKEPVTASKRKRSQSLEVQTKSQRKRKSSDKNLSNSDLEVVKLLSPLNSAIGFESNSGRSSSNQHSSANQEIDANSRSHENKPITDKLERNLADQLRYLSSEPPSCRSRLEDGTRQRMNLETQPRTAKAYSTSPLKQPHITGSSRRFDLVHGSDSLRQRPLNQLNLAHFKPNPKYTEGFDHVFEKAARNQQQRKCMSGCTREACCGKQFRVLSKSMPENAHVPTSWHEPSLSDDELIRTFLGSNSRVDIESLTPTARENLLQEARTKVCADKFGKMHRNDYERPKSPPGFWRTEMPGTQEKAVDRNSAEVNERREVERRFLEAQNSGRWIFIDEKD